MTWSKTSRTRWVPSARCTRGPRVLRSGWRGWRQEQTGSRRTCLESRLLRASGMLSTRWRQDSRRMRACLLQLPPSRRGSRARTRTSDGSRGGRVMTTRGSTSGSKSSKTTWTARARRPRASSRKRTAPAPAITTPAPRAAPRSATPPGHPGRMRRRRMRCTMMSRRVTTPLASKWCHRRRGVCRFLPPLLPTLASPFLPETKSKEAGRQREEQLGESRRARSTTRGRYGCWPRSAMRPLCRSIRSGGSTRGWLRGTGRWRTRWRAPSNTW
mmetsp:Transcript_18397/g.41404  ORF Transcript_18397/g.41404 Transcript_18397/m.41404 type:complete len:271 (-) Transcript_18397:680-1492(-)